MAAIIDTISEGLKRVTGIIPASTDYYTATWWVYIPANPSTGTVRTLYMVANSANRSGQSIVVLQDDTGKICLEIAGVRQPGTIISPGWHSVLVGRRVPANFIEVRIDGSPISTHTGSGFSAWTFDELYLGMDPRINSITQQMSYFREWPVFHNNPNAELKSPVPVLTTDLTTDTPLGAGLTDITSNHNDWTMVGTLTFTNEPTSNFGAMGGWWLTTPWSIHSGAEKPLIRFETDSGYAFQFWILHVLSEFTGTPAVLTQYNYDVHIQYYDGTATLATQTVNTPLQHPKLGSPLPFGARRDWATPMRWAVSWKFSTWDRATNTYANDGELKMWMNDTMIASSTGIKLPRRADGTLVTYSYGVNTDLDRVWARAENTIPPTTAQGAFVTPNPSGLVFFDDFDTGYASPWTKFTTFSGGGTPSDPVSHATGGGDGTRGLSIYQNPPDNALTGSLVATYTGISRTYRFPPVRLTGDPDGASSVPEPEPDPNDDEIVFPPFTTDASGIYYSVATSNTHVPSTLDHDKYYGDQDRKILNPVIRTALFGE